MHGSSVQDIPPSMNPHPLELYRWAVQDPATHAALLRLIHHRLRPAGKPTTLREDFAGTSADAVAWVAMSPDHSAVAIDLDESTLSWASARAARLLGTRADSIRFLAADVTRTRPPAVPKADIISALNYSTLYLLERDALLRYLRAVRDGLAPGGILVANFFGGEHAFRTQITRHRVTPAPALPGEHAPPPFWYEWEVLSRYPSTARIECAIHFELDPPASASKPLTSQSDAQTRIANAFHYRWKLWTPRELLAACADAGFASAAIWRHTHDASPGNAGVFLGPVDPASLDALPLWNAYLVAGS